MEIKVLAMKNDYYEGYIIIGVSSSQRFFKARLSDSIVSSSRRIGVDDIIDTEDFLIYEEWTFNQVKAFIEKK